MDIDLEAILQRVYEYLAQYGLKIVGALIIFIVGRWLAKFISQIIEKALIKSHVDKTLAKFAKNFSNMALLIFVVIAAVARLGVETAQFAIVVGAAGLAIGLALQGSLSNFASGFLILELIMVKGDDYVSANFGSSVLSFILCSVNSCGRDHLYKWRPSYWENHPSCGR